MIEPISRTELYQRVDTAFHERFPDAPAQMSASTKPEWRQWWIQERDRQLNEEINRVYWARYPDAPVELDSTSPEWENWRISWANIRDELMSNAPAPEDVQLQNAVDADGKLDLTYLKAAVRKSFADREDIQPDILDDIVARADELAEELGAQAMQSRDMHAEWRSRVVEVKGRGSHKVTFGVMAWWDSHYLTGAVTPEYIVPEFLEDAVA